MLLVHTPNVFIGAHAPDVCETSFWHTSKKNIFFAMSESAAAFACTAGTVIPNLCWMVEKQHEMWSEPQACTVWIGASVLPIATLLVAVTPDTFLYMRPTVSAAVPALSLTAPTYVIPLKTSLIAYHNLPTADKNYSLFLQWEQHLLRGAHTFFYFFIKYNSTLWLFIHIISVFLAFTVFM